MEPAPEKRFRLGFVKYEGTKRLELTAINHKKGKFTLKYLPPDRGIGGVTHVDCVSWWRDCLSIRVVQSKKHLKELRESAKAAEFKTADPDPVTGLPQLVGKAGRKGGGWSRPEDAVWIRWLRDEIAFDAAGNITQGQALCPEYDKTL